MQINKLTKEELEKELNRAYFWVEKSKIGDSIKLIKKMEYRLIELVKKN